MAKKRKESKRKGPQASKAPEEKGEESDGNIEKKNKPTIDHLGSDWLGNVNTFNEIIKDPDKVKEISDITENEYPEIREYQRKLTRMILRTFPGIEKQFREEDLKFRARILRIPFYRKSRDLQHDCVQKYLAEEQGQINIATGSKKILADTLYVDMPIFAPKARGDALLYDQKRLLEASMPSIQRDCLIKAQPLAVADKVYDYPGRWLIWRLVFDLNRAEKIGQDADAVPLYAQRLTNLRLASLFPFAGTTDGELALIVIEKREENDFRDGIGKMKADFGLETKYIDAEITISWESVVDLGILPYAAEPHLPQVGKVFKQKLKEKILKDTIMDFGSFTEKNNVSEQKNANGTVKCLAELMAIGITHRELERVFHVVQNVPESMMKLYEIKGGGEIK